MNESIAVLLTCFNRKEKTLNCLKTLLDKTENPSIEELDIHVYLVNDGCTDGTPDAVEKEFPEVNIIQGDGSLFWNMGMHLAFETATKESYNYYLWVNDDVLFEKDIIAKLLNTSNSLENPLNSIVVAYTTDDTGKEITYGGYVRKKTFMPLTMEMVQPGNEPKSCETFNGNCVLIPQEIVKTIGINSDKYRHGFGDVDYGFRAIENGFEIYLTDYPAGICEKNPNAKIWNDIHYKAPIREKYKAMTNIRCRPNNEWLYYTKRFGGKKWMLRFVSPYFKLIISAIVSRF